MFLFISMLFPRTEAFLMARNSLYLSDHGSRASVHDHVGCPARACTRGAAPLAPRSINLICSDQLLPEGVHTISVRFGLVHGGDVPVVQRGTPHRLRKGIVPGIGSWRSFGPGPGPSGRPRCGHLAQSRTGRSGRTVGTRSAWVRGDGRTRAGIGRCGRLVRHV